MRTLGSLSDLRALTRARPRLAHADPQGDVRLRGLRLRRGAVPEGALPGVAVEHGTLGELRLKVSEGSSFFNDIIRVLLCEVYGMVVETS